MAIDIEMLKSMAARCSEITKVASSLHLADVAKAIELQTGRQIFIQYISEKTKLGNYPGFTANCDPWKIAQPKKQGKWENVFIQHFIFYKSDKDPEVERYRVAHELGHLIIHWPLNVDMINRRKHCVLPKIGKFFLVPYTHKEEEEADAFAILLGVHMPKIKTPKEIRVSPIVKRKITEFRKKGILISHTLKKSCYP